MRFFYILAIGLMFSGWFRVEAQLTSQSILLKPGWNAVYVGVQPEPRDTTNVLAGLPVESVWMWNREFSPVQFIQNPNVLKPNDPDWLVYSPQANVFKQSLHAILAGRTYLIKMAGAASVNWLITGKPYISAPRWVPNSFNLVGGVFGATPPTFSSFFSPSSGHNTAAIFRLDQNGLWEKLAAPELTPMRSGEAFWIELKGASEYQGPLQITLDQVDRLDFGRTLSEQRIRIKNASSSTQEIKLNKVASLPGASNIYNLPLAVKITDIANQRLEWLPLAGEHSLGTLVAGGELSVQIAVQRELMANEHAALDAEDFFAAVLCISDANGAFNAQVPVTAQPLLASRVGGEAVNRFAGLWVGTAVINAVSEPNRFAENMLPRPTATEAQFRLIIHVDASGNARLLQQVYQLWKDGVRDAQGKVLEPGRFVLVADESRVDLFKGATVRDGQSVGRRFSSVAFAFKSPQPMHGPFGSFTETLTCSLVLGYDDPLNPFKHRFHPDHDNLTENFRTVLVEGQESYSVVRKLTLRFTAEDLLDLSLPEYGSKHLGGIYEEEIIGVHREAIFVKGYFRLNHASTIPVLNDGLN